ncbi:MAG TPA: methylglyoxal synthase [Flavisolibacter sp.]|nr:methylglyoxal synthase [Flavisolibacter sp.]
MPVMLIAGIYFKTQIMNASRNIGASKRIALVAHDYKKADLLDWAAYNKDTLARHELIATGTTGALLEEIAGTRVTKLLSGPLGGDQQIGAMIAEGKIDILVFFWDPMEAQAHDSDVKALLRIAVAWNIVIACNRSTADFILTSMLMHSEHAVHLPDYSGYLKRRIGTVE